jgi:hypothetical protein
MNTATEEETVAILSKVKEISETKRNPTWKDNAQRMKGGKVCNSAAGPRDLGATKKDQSMTKKMKALAELGYLKRLPSRAFPYFTLTDEGLKYIAASKPNKKKN